MWLDRWLRGAGSGPAGAPLAYYRQNGAGAPALNLPSQKKYQHEGGPSLEACFEVIARFSAAPARDRLRLISWVIFNFLIGNSDAHAKNLSLLITREGVSLAPCCDLLSTAVYPGLTAKPAPDLIPGVGRSRRASEAERRSALA